MDHRPSVVVGLSYTCSGSAPSVFRATRVPLKPAAQQRAQPLHRFTECDVRTTLRVAGHHKAAKLCGHKPDERPDSCRRFNGSCHFMAFYARGLHVFHATTSVWEKQKWASGSRPQARQAAAMSSNSELVAIPNSKALSARLECKVRSA
jgi:hypothetical protein